MSSNYYSTNVEDQNQPIVTDIIKRRISEVLRTNPILNQKVSRELNIALAGTSTEQEGIDAAVRLLYGTASDEKKREVLSEVALYRIIYSNPDLKAEIESVPSSGSGRLGETPPLSPPILVRAVFNSENHRTVEWVSDEFLEIWYPLAGLLIWFCLDVTVASEMIGEVILPWLIIQPVGFLVVGRFLRCWVQYQRRKLISDGCVCCECGLSTRALHHGTPDSRHQQNILQGRTFRTGGTPAIYHRSCTNCGNTAVCQIGCKTCNPFVVPREDAIRRVDIQRAIESDPDLKNRFDAKVEDSILELSWAGNTAPLTHQTKTELILKMIDSEPALYKDIEIVVSRLKDNGNYQVEDEVLSAVLTRASLVNNETDGSTVDGRGTFQTEMELPIVHAHAVLTDPSCAVVHDPNDDQTVAAIV